MKTYGLFSPSSSSFFFFFFFFFFVYFFLPFPQFLTKKKKKKKILAFRHLKTSRKKRSGISLSSLNNKSIYYVYFICDQIHGFSLLYRKITAEQE